MGHNFVDDVMASMTRYRYRSHTGPLWCVKVLLGYNPGRPSVASGENVSRPDTGLGTSSPEGEDKELLLPRPDTGFGAHPSEPYDCRPLMPGQVIGVPVNEPHRCVILQPQAPAPEGGVDPQQQYDDPLMGAVGGDVQGVEGADFARFDPGYRAVSPAYRGPSPEQEEAYGSGGSGEVSRVSPSDDPHGPGIYQGEDVDPFRMERRVGEGALASDPPSRPSSNPSFYGRRGSGSPATAPPNAPAAGAGGEGQGELGYGLSEFTSEEEAAGAAAATAAATAVAPKDVGSSRSSFVGTSSSASPAFLDTGSSSLSSSPRRGPSPPSLPAQGAIGGNFECSTSVVFGIHQGIADCITGMKICGRFVKLINDTVAGIEIDDSVPLEENSVTELRDVLNSRMILLSDLTKQEELRAEIEARNNWESSATGIFKECPPGPGGAGGRAGRRPRHRNRHEGISFDSDSTRRFLDRCQAEGVRVMAAMSAIFNIALMDVLTARDVIKDTYRFFSGHNVNLRSYTGAMDAPHLMGCLMSPVHLSVPTPRHAADNFWEFARRFEADLKHAEERDEAMRELALMEMNPPRASDYDDLFREPLPQMKDYFTTFLDDVTPLVTEGGPHVVVEYTEAAMSRHKLGYACSFVLHLYQNSLCVSLNYSSRYLTLELAKEYISNVYRRVHEII